MGRGKEAMKKISAMAVTSMVAATLAGTPTNAQANPFHYNPLGSGADVRVMMEELNHSGKSVFELSCGGETKSKATEAKCGEKGKTENKASEAKCGEKGKQEATKKGEKKSTEAKATEAKCGEGKCGEKSSKSEKKESATQTGQSKTTESKCGEGKCGQ